MVPDNIWPSAGGDATGYVGPYGDNVGRPPTSENDTVLPWLLPNWSRSRHGLVGIVNPLEPTLYELLHRLSAESGLSSPRELTKVTLRVVSRDVSLQRLHLYAPNVTELRLDGSRMTSLRDLGCELVNLKILHVSRCGLDSLDGTNGLSEILREIHAERNAIRDITPCVSLQSIKCINVRSNPIRDLSHLGFLTLCPELHELILAGCPAARLTPNYRTRVKELLPQLRALDGLLYSVENELEGKQDEEESSNNSRDLSKLSIDENDTPNDKQSPENESRIDKKTNTNFDEQRSKNPSDEACPSNNLAANENFAKNARVQNIPRNIVSFDGVATANYDSESDNESLPLTGESGEVACTPKGLRSLQPGLSLCGNLATALRNRRGNRPSINKQNGQNLSLDSASKFEHISSKEKNANKSLLNGSKKNRKPSQEPI